MATGPAASPSTAQPLPSTARTIPSLLNARTLGRTGLSVGPLGVAASYGAGEDAVGYALDHGCNYLYWGTLRRSDFGLGLRCALRDRRQEVVLVIQSYARLGLGVEWSLKRALKQLGTDHADVLLLGYWQSPVWEGVLEAAKRLCEQGKTRFVAVSTHNRPLAGKWVADANSPIDIVHVRYNAAHRGAEREIFPQRVARGPGIVSFTATRWGSLLKPQSNMRTPTAADCYRFVLAQSAVDVCLSGPRNLDDLHQAVAALEKGPMDAEELDWMRKVGDRVYGRPLQRMIGE